eukprot:7451436-Pyramimonas_sp.AAC.1
MKLVTSTWMFITDENVDQLNYWAKKKNLEHVKREFRRQADKAPAPPVFIQDLPGSPAELLTKFPQIYHLAFTAEDVPSACPLDLRKLRELDDSYTCRGGKTPQRGADSSGAICTRDSDTSSSMERLMMQQMQQMNFLAQLAARAIGHGGHGPEPQDLLRSANFDVFDAPRRPSRHRALAAGSGFQEVHGAAAGDSAAEAPAAAARPPPVEVLALLPPRAAEQADGQAGQSQPAAAPAGVQQLCD